MSQDLIYVYVYPLLLVHNLNVMSQDSFGLCFGSAFVAEALRVTAQTSALARETRRALAEKCADLS